MSHKLLRRKTVFIVAFLFQTNRDHRSKDLIPSQALKEAKRIRMGENTNQTLLNHTDEAIRPHTPEKITKIRDQSRGNPGEETSLVKGPH